MFKVGDIVKIRKDSKYYLGEYSNPKDISGKIDAIFTYSDIWVKWSNGAENCYSQRDLEFFQGKPVFAGLRNDI